MAKKLYKITTACKLIQEYTATSNNFNSLQDVYDNFDFCGEPKEIDCQNEDFEKVEVSMDGGKTWQQAK